MKLISSLKESHNQLFQAVMAKLMTSGLPASVAAVIGELVVGVVMLFVGLFMIDIVATATAINNSSSFYSISTALITTTGQVFTVLGLVIIIVALATAIGSLKSVMT